MRRFDDLVGRTDLARQVGDGGAGIDLARPARDRRRARGRAHRASAACPGDAPAAPLDREVLALAGDALARGEQVTVERAVRNTDRAIGALLSGEIVRRLGPDALADGALTLRLAGTAGQSLGAWGIRGLVLDLEGQANDYVGKGLSGARIVVRPPAGAGYEPTSSIAVGNTTLYGATSGELFVRGRARRALRRAQLGRDRRRRGRRAPRLRVHDGRPRRGARARSAATSRPACPAASPTSGIRTARTRAASTATWCCCAPSATTAALRELLERHRELTGSDVAAALLADWDTSVAQFVEVMPHDLLRIAAERDPELEGARG